MSEHWGDTSWGTGSVKEICARALAKSWFALILISFSLTGCASPAQTTVQMPAGAGQQFSWTAEMQRIKNTTADDFVKKVLDDNKISDQEYAEMVNRFRKCLIAGQVTMSEFRFDGSYDFSFPDNMSSDEAHQVTTSCSRLHGEGEVGYLYTGMRRNPESRDDDQIIAECLIKTQVVAPSYTGATYLAESLKGIYSFTDTVKGPGALKKCKMDPLGLTDK